MSAEPAYPHEPTPVPARPVAPPADGPLDEGELAIVPRPEERPALNQAAESIGGAVGKAVQTVQHLPQRVQEMKERFTVIRGRAQADTAAKASQVAEDLKDQARQRLELARTRAQRLAHRYPLQTILAMAGAGLLLGIVLRIWRDHAD